MWLQQVSLLFFLSGLNPILSITSSSQIQALQLLYNSTNGEEWDWKSELLYGPIWSFGLPQSDPCNDDSKPWQGITCSASPAICRTQQCVIRSIVLDSTNLVGTIPADIFLPLTSLTSFVISNSPKLVGPLPSTLGILSQLQTLDLTSNRLMSSIPPEFGQLEQLGDLSLSSNLFSGRIPTEIGLLSLLISAILDGNQFRGSLPSEIGSLTSLTMLEISSNKLTGNIPREIGKLSKLKTFRAISNQFNGSIPAEIGSLTTLESLYLTNNDLSGKIPPEIGNLTQLQNFYASYNHLMEIPSEFGYLQSLRMCDLSYNDLASTIPSTIGLLSQILQLHLQINKLSGSIPHTISQLTTIQLLNLGVNRLTHTLPSGIGSLSDCGEFDVHYNRLWGPIPPSIGNMTKARILWWTTNRLTGPIPSQIGSLTSLTTLFINDNKFRGPLPSTIGSLTNLMLLDISKNRLTGTIPSEVGNMTKLLMFSLYANSLEGRLPPTIYQLDNLFTLSLESNFLSGSISSSIVSLTRLTFLGLSNNQLNGSLPVDIGALQYLVFFSLSNNQLTGMIPSQVFRMTQLLYLQLDSNYLTSSIPREVGQLSTLEVLSLSQNHLTGSIPQISNLTRLVEIHLYENSLTGTIPFSLLPFPGLRQLFLHRNKLSGSLGEVLPSYLNASALDYGGNMTNIDVSDNLLTGSIPPVLFFFPRLQSISLSLNCFEHKIPYSICDARDTEVISMDGLRSAEDCENSVSVSFLFFNKIKFGQTMEGSIPDCVWFLSNLKTLNLAGNGLKGKIGSAGNMPSLRNMTLSHNYLSGAIPAWLQQKNMTLLDLSHNKLTGDVNQFLDHAAESTNLGGAGVLFGNQTQATKILKLSVNRLSGDLSHFFDTFTVLDILSGNLFSCDYIPRDDKKSEWIPCGSLEYDRTMSVMAALLGLLLGIGVFYLISMAVVYFRSSHQRKSSMLTWLEKRILDYHHLIRYMRYYRDTSIDHQRTQSESTILFGYFLANVMKSVVALCCVSFLVTSPIYILKQVDVKMEQTHNEDVAQYVTHSHMYRWLWTMAFLSGTLPAVLLLTATLVCLTLFTLGLYYLKKTTAPPAPSNFSMKSRDDSRSTSLTTKLIQVPEQSSSKTSIQLSVMVWVILILNLAVVGTVNGLYLWSILADLSTYVRIWIQVGFGFFSSVWYIFLVKRLPSQVKESSYGVWLFTCLSLLNNVLIPCLVTALSSPSCYQQLLVPPDKISSSYSYQACNYYFQSYNDIDCKLYVRTLMSPLRMYPPFTYSYQCGSALLTAYIPVYIYSISVQIFFILFKMTIILSSNLIQYSTKFMSLFPGVCWPDLYNRIDASHSTVKIIHAHDIISSISNNLVLLLSFGICSPVLGWSIAGSICLNISSWLLLIGRFISLRTSHHSRDEFVANLNHHTTGVQSSLEVSKWPVVFTSCVFITLLCWDIVGDKVGWYGGLWVPGTGLGMILLIWLWNQMLAEGVLDQVLPRTLPMLEADLKSMEFVSSSLHPVG